jgi:hypothetical protein
MRVLGIVALSICVGVLAVASAAQVLWLVVVALGGILLTGGVAVGGADSLEEDDALDDAPVAPPATITSARSVRGRGPRGNSLQRAA